MVAQEPVTVMFNRVFDAIAAMIPASSLLPLVSQISALIGQVGLDFVPIKYLIVRPNHLI
jgi:hypothetical protein